jgi:hypothetical protein
MLIFGELEETSVSDKNLFNPILKNGQLSQSMCIIDFERTCFLYLKLLYLISLNLIDLPGAN